MFSGTGNNGANSYLANTGVDVTVPPLADRPGLPIPVEKTFTVATAHLRASPVIQPGQQLVVRLLQNGGDFLPTAVTITFLAGASPGDTISVPFNQTFNPEDRLDVRLEPNTNFGFQAVSVGVA